MPLYDSAELLDTIKKRGSIPVNAGSWDDPSLLKAASDVITEWHLPMLVAAKGEYLIKETQTPLVQGQREYLISYRSAAVRLIALVNKGSVENPLDEMTPRGQSDIYIDHSRQGCPRFYTWREGYVQLWPLPMSITDKLKVLWHIRPSRITLTTNCWQISNITPNSPTAGQTTLGFNSAAPTTMAGIVGTLYDFVGIRNPFPIKGFDVAGQSIVTGASSTTMQFNSADLPTDLAVNDWACPPENTPMPNIVQELHVAVAKRTAAVAVRSRQSMLAMTLDKEAQEVERNLLGGLLQPRSKGNPRRLVQRRWMRK